MVVQPECSIRSVVITKMAAAEFPICFQFDRENGGDFDADNLTSLLMTFSRRKIEEIGRIFGRARLSFTGSLLIGGGLFALSGVLFTVSSLRQSAMNSASDQAAPVEIPPCRAMTSRRIAARPLIFLRLLLPVGEQFEFNGT